MGLSRRRCVLRDRTGLTDFGHMDSLSRLQLLSSQMSLEPAEDTASRAASGDTPPSCYTPRQRDGIYIEPAQLPNGKQIKLLKTLLTSACERDCYYCPFRAGRDFRRATFKPDEFASLFMQLHQGRIAEGIFLSSGIAGGGSRTQDRLLDTAEVLRRKHGYRGYLHLKIMPGAEPAQIERAMQLADRVSVNLEAPNTERLQRLAPRKDFIEELIAPLKLVENIRRTQAPTKSWNGRWPSTTTQYVVGGSDESDLELLQTTAWLNKHAGLKRAYFSAFNPVRDTPLENKEPTDPMREHRLYQASFLLRDYGFELEDMPFAQDGFLPLSTDPKLAWAQQNLLDTPIEINRAERRELLRIPGIGPRTANALLALRKDGGIRDLAQLKKLGVAAGRAAPFILMDGKRVTRQLPLFAGSGA